jgi:hypothetical protein
VAIIDWDVHVANGAERITASPSTRSSRRSCAASGPTVPRRPRGGRRSRTRGDRRGAERPAALVQLTAAQARR